MTTGYDFYFDTPYGLLTFPVTPGELSIKVGSNNETVTLINEGDVNILKSPALVEVDFEARFPMRNYPFARKVQPFEDYYNIIKKVKEEKKPFRFIVARRNPKGSRTWDTNLLMALEEFEIKESADEGDDVLVSFSLKQYKEYGVKQVKITLPKKEDDSAKKKPTTTSTSNKNRDSKKDTSTKKTYTVKKGDTLWAIAKKYYGNGNLYDKIYKANKSIIEKTAKKYGKKSSSNGHWIYPGTKLTIPPK